jgi:hypothetical protein
MKRILIIVGFLFTLIVIHFYVVLNYKYQEFRITTNKDSVFTKSYFVPRYATFHIWKGRLQYTKTNGWHETIQFNVKSYKQIK